MLTLAQMAAQQNNQQNAQHMTAQQNVQQHTPVNERFAQIAQDLAQETEAERKYNLTLTRTAS
jgi:hypothetical protein